MGITILPPDINKSGLKFTPEMVAAAPSPSSSFQSATGASRPQSSAIRYGLAAIKHVGETAMEAAIREREQRGDFASLEDFCARLDSRVANRKMLEALIKAGAFDFLGRDRSELFSCIDHAVSASAAAQRDRIAGQVSLFDEATAPTGSKKGQ
jgi:DNA polymerase-3 subunit alpha